MQRSCNASALDVLRGELSRVAQLDLTAASSAEDAAPSLVVTNFPQWLLSAEGLHDGGARPSYYAAHHTGCVTRFAGELLEAYRELDEATRGGLVLLHHLDLSRWGGTHLEKLIFSPLEHGRFGLHSGRDQRRGSGSADREWQRAIPVVRMQDAWQQGESSHDSHMRGDAIYWLAWSRVLAAVAAQDDLSHVDR